jgi:hypothetical protein
MKTLWKITACAAVAGALLVSVGLLFGANTNGFYVDTNGVHVNSENQFTLVCKSDIDVISQINIDVASAHVRVIQADSYGFEIYGKDGRFNYSFVNGRLEISQRHIFSIGFMFKTPQEYVEIRLPQGAILDDVSMRIASGKIDVESLRCDTLDLRLTSGRANLVNVQTNTTVMRVTSGSIILNNAVSDSFNFALSSGNITANGLQSGGLHATATSGNINLSGVFYGNTTANVTSGRIRVDVDGIEQDYNRVINVTSGRVNVNSVRSGSGNVNYNAQNTLDISAISGNIDISFLQ